MRFLILAAACLLALLTATPALASGAPAAKEDAGDMTELELPMLVAPVTVNGRLYHYAYMRILLKAKDSATADIARDKVPFILDAMLRETHRATITANNDPQQIDGKGLEKRLFDTANATIGPGSFVSLTFRDTIQTDDPASNQTAAEAAADEAAAAEFAAQTAKKPEASAHH